MKTILMLAVAASLSACATTRDRLASAAPAIAAVQSAYDQARGFAALFLPFLPDAQRARVEALGLAVERALALARAASSAAAQARAIEDARAAADTYRLATGG